MLILKNRVYSKKEEKSSKDIEALKTIGKTGLITGGVLGTAAGVELGKSIKEVNDIKGDISGIKKLRKNKYIREKIKDTIKNITPTHSDSIIEKIRFSEKHFPKINKIDKYTNLAKFWNNTAKNVSRTTLDNADRYTKLAIDKVESEIGDKLGDVERKHLKRIPAVVKKAAKSITHLKNARILGRTAAVVGGFGGTSYINGRMIEGDNRK